MKTLMPYSNLSLHRCPQCGSRSCPQPCARTLHGTFVSFHRKVALTIQKMSEMMLRVGAVRPVSVPRNRMCVAFAEPARHGPATFTGDGHCSS